MAEELPDFDALAVVAHDGSKRLVGEREFVRAALSIEAWYMIGVAAPDTPDELEPLIAQVQQAPHLVAFTDEDRAAGFARSQAAKVSKAEAAPVLHMSPSDAVGYLQRLRELGVQGVHFNDGPLAVTIDASRIVELAGG